MKKSAFFMFVLLLAITGLFAEDAKVLPARVLRLTTAPTYGFETGEWDQASTYVESVANDGSLQAFNLGFALEYGITDFLTAAIQWTPGVNLWSKIDRPVSMHVNGFFDLFAGAKVQMVGQKGFISNETIRFAVAPGIKIPTPGANFAKELENFNAGKSFQPVDVDTKTVGFGGRLYFDYVINSNFFINAYVEGTTYLERKNYVRSLELAFSNFSVDYKPGTEFTFELEPQVEFPLGDAISFSAGLPLRYEMVGDMRIDGSVVRQSGVSLVSIVPNISLFLKEAFIPTEIGLQYTLPLSGINNRAMHAVTITIKNYLKF